MYIYIYTYTYHYRWKHGLILDGSAQDTSNIYISHMYNMLVLCIYTQYVTKCQQITCSPTFGMSLDSNSRYISLLHAKWCFESAACFAGLYLRDMGWFSGVLLQSAALASNNA